MILRILATVTRLLDKSVTFLQPASLLSCASQTEGLDLQCRTVSWLLLHPQRLQMQMVTFGALRCITVPPWLLDIQTGSTNISCSGPFHRV